MYRFLALSLNGEESLKKLNNYSRIQIRIQIFTKIEAILPCHTPNLSTKFRPNTSTTFEDIVQYIVLAQSLNGEESLKNYSCRIRIRIFTKIESIHPRHTPNLSTTFKLLFEISIHNFLRYSAHKQTERQTNKKDVM